MKNVSIIYEISAKPPQPKILKTFILKSKDIKQVKVEPKIFLENDNLIEE